jgi:hypothetical protein
VIVRVVLEPVLAHNDIYHTFCPELSRIFEKGSVRSHKLKVGSSLFTLSAFRRALLLFLSLFYFFFRILVDWLPPFSRRRRILLGNMFGLQAYLKIFFADTFSVECRYGGHSRVR